MLLGTVAAMPPLFDRVRDALSPARRHDRHNAAALASRLGVSLADAAWIVGRSREVGYGATMLEYEEICRQRQAR